jgi:hypothetical protein
MPALFAILCLIFGVTAAQAQGKELNQKFLFTDGVFAKYADFQTNTPSFSLKNISTFNYNTNKEGDILVVAPYTVEAFANQGLHLDSVWGLAMNGRAYIRVPNYDKSSKEVIFVHLYVQGNLCYYYHNVTNNTQVMMEVYNPLTRKKIGERPIQNRKKVIKEFVFDFETGTSRPYTDETVGELIQSDKKLYKSWEETPKPIARETLFKILLIYNEQHPVRIKNR